MPRTFLRVLIDFGLDWAHLLIHCFIFQLVLYSQTAECKEVNCFAKLPYSYEICNEFYLIIKIINTIQNIILNIK